MCERWDVAKGAQGGRVCAGLRADSDAARAAGSEYRVFAADISPFASPIRGPNIPALLPHSPNTSLRSQPNVPMSQLGGYACIFCYVTSGESELVCRSYGSIQFNGVRFRTHFFFFSRRRAAGARSAQMCFFSAACTVTEAL